MQQHTRLFIFIVSILVIIFCSWIAESFAFKKAEFWYDIPFGVRDTIKKDSLKKEKPLRGRRPKPEKPKKNIDTIKKKDTIKKTNGALEDVVKYEAKDSIVFNKAGNEIILYNQTNVKYTDIDISAGIDVINYQKGEVYAGRVKDSTGEYSQHPIFKQGNDVIEPDSIRFNYRNQKAIIRNAYTKQDENNVRGQIIKM